MKNSIALGMMTFALMALVSTQTAFAVTGYGGSGGGGSLNRVQKFTRTQLQTPKQVQVQVPAQALNVPKGKSPQGQVQGATKFQFGKDLNLGSTMSDVRELQKMLRAEGFFTYPEDTGYFGEMTREAVMAFQKARGISPVSGYVGPLTRAELNKGTIAQVVTTAAKDEMTTAELIELLITLEIIPADKAEQARGILDDDSE